MCNFSAMEKKHYCCFCICTIIISSITIVCVCQVMYQSSKPLRHKSLEPINTLIFWVQGAYSRDDRSIDCAAKGYFFLPRIYVASATGNMSLQKAWVLEDNMVARIQEAHLPWHINLQWNILKFKSSLFREDAMGEVELDF